jgi:phosphate transport system protein
MTEVAASSGLTLAEGHLINMANAVRKSMHEATSCLIVPNLTKAETVIETDIIVDDIANQLDSLCIELVADQVHDTTTVRQLLSILRIASSLERMGDLAVHIAKAARRRYPDSALPAELVPTFERMGSVADSVMALTLSAMQRHDRTLWDEIHETDDQMDALHREMFRVVLSPGWEYGMEAAIDVTLLSRYFERYADHSVSIMRRMIHMITGEPYANTESED